VAITVEGRVDLRGRRVVLTGASRGIGVALAEAFAKEGAHLLLIARDEDALFQTVMRVRALGGEAEVCAADLTSEEGRERCVARALAPDVWVHNAGVEVPLPVVEQTPQDIEAQVQLNLVAPIALTRAVLPGMIARGRGAVVAISSMSGKSPTPYNAVYTATKHGVNGFFSTLRLELLDTGVHAGVVCPSFVADAGMWADWGVAAPGLMREVPLARVVRATRQAIDGAPEVLVTPDPVRPLLALAQLFPKLDGAVLRALGVTAALRARADEVARRRSAGGGDVSA
jgi:short-subunit dehydrogenase